MIYGSKGNSTAFSNSSGNGSVLKNYASIMSGMRAGSSMAKLKEDNVLRSDVKSETAFKNNIYT